MSQQKAALKTVGLMIVLGLLIAGDILSRDKTERDPILTFNPPGCVLPCVLGVTPGETDFNNAVAILEDSPQVQGINRGVEFEIEDQQGYPITLIIRRESPLVGNNVGWIDIYAEWNKSITTLGPFLDRYGNPEQTFRIRATGPNVVVLLTSFENGSILAEIVAVDQVGPNSEIDHLRIIAPYYVESGLEELTLIQHFDDEVTWLGYAPIEAYWEQ